MNIFDFVNEICYIVDHIGDTFLIKRRLNYYIIWNIITLIVNFSTVAFMRFIDWSVFTPRSAMEQARTLELLVEKEYPVLSLMMYIVPALIILISGLLNLTPILIKKTHINNSQLQGCMFHPVLKLYYDN